MVWGALTLAAFQQLIQMFAASVLIPSLLVELKLSYALAGTLTSAYMLSLSAALVPVGAIGDRLGGRYLMLGGILLMSLGSAVFVVADSFAIAILSRVLVGAGAAAVLVLPPPMLAYWFEKNQYRIVVGLNVSVGKMGSVLAAWVLPLLVVGFGWRLGYGIISLFGPLALVVGLLLIYNRPTDLGLSGMHTLAVARPHGEHAPRPTGSLPLRRLIRDRNLLLIAASQFFVFTNYFGLVNWLPTYFKTTLALSEVEAGFQTGFVLWGTILGFAVSGVLANLLGRCAPLYAAGAALSGVMAAVMASGSLGMLPLWLWPAFMLVFGLSVSVMVLTMPIMAGLFPPNSMATANGITLTAGYSGAMVAPALIGLVADLTGALTTGFWVGVVAAALGFCTSIFIRETVSPARPE